MRPELDDLRPKIAKILKCTFYAEWDKEYPECLDLIVLGDVEPKKMEKVCDLLRKKGKEKFRLCANIIDEDPFEIIKDAFDSGGFDSAFRESWNWNVATVRMG